MRLKRVFGKICIAVVLLTGLVSCNSNRATIDNNIKQYFDQQKVDGSFTMLDNKGGKITVYNMQWDTTRFCPASTFKIVNSLIGLQTGVISSDTMMIKWDGITRSRPEWNKDLTMTEAFKVSAVPYYQEIARRIGRDTMQNWLDSLHYGNAKIGAGIDNFWLDNSLKISPDEQLGFMKKLYFDQLPFQKTVMQTVRNVMLMEDNTAYQLSYKTGLVDNANNQSIGWVTGWIEENKHVYFFTLLVKSAANNPAMAQLRLPLLKSILKHYGFFEGKK